MKKKSQLKMGCLYAECDRGSLIDQDCDDDHQDNNSGVVVQRKLQKDHKRDIDGRKHLNTSEITTDFVFSDPPQDIPSLYQYFKIFITDDIIKYIANETNLWKRDWAETK